MNLPNGYGHSNDLLRDLAGELSKISARAEMEQYFSTNESGAAAFTLNENQIESEDIPRGLRIFMNAAEPNHNKPHVHVYFVSAEKNIVSKYNVEDGLKMEGNLPAKYDQRTSEWICEHKEELLNLWENRGDGALYSLTGKVDWINDLEDENSPASCRLTLLSNSHVEGVKSDSISLKGDLEFEFEISKYWILVSNNICTLYEIESYIDDTHISVKNCGDFDFQEDPKLEKPLQLVIGDQLTLDATTLLATLPGFSLESLRQCYGETR
jgi:Domain of unknown function (DUF4160)